MKPPGADVTVSEEGPPSEHLATPGRRKSADAQRHVSQDSAEAAAAAQRRGVDQKHQKPGSDEEHISFWRTTSHGDLNLSMPAMEHDAEVHPAPLGGEAETVTTAAVCGRTAPTVQHEPVDFHEHGYVRDELTGALHHTKQ